MLAGCGGEPQTPAPTPTAAADCTGAAARAPGRPPCPDAIPATASATGRGTPCRRTEPLGPVEPCAFGAQAGTTFALIGDSHAGQLRSAFDVAARELGWRGYALTRNGCPFVRDGRPLPEPEFSQCVEFKRQIPEWLARHPEVKVVFVIGLARNAAQPSDPSGYVATLQSLPPSVEHVVVIRDTPEVRQDALACVSAAIERSEPPGPVCATPRAQALPPDPAVAAAERLGAQTIDLTRYFCDAERCFPVVGGMLAYQDFTHVAPAFAATLGPYLFDEVKRASASW